MIESPIAWLNQNKIKYRDAGQEFEIGCLIKNCPNQGEPQMYINKRTGKFFCHRCGVKGGTLKQLEFKAELVTFRESTDSSHIYIPATECDSYHKELMDNPDALDYMTRVRGLTKQTLVQFNLGYCLKEDAIVIPFYDQSEACVGLKYYYYNKPVKPKTRFEKNSKVCFYGLHLVDLNKPLYVTEGEFDAMTLWQFGYRNVGSIPNGAQGLNGWVEDIGCAPLYYICTDNDTSGHDCTTNLGEKLGLTKCKRVVPRLKDWNEYLERGLNKDEISKPFKGAKSMFNAPVRDIADYKDQASDALRNPQVQRGTSTGWANIDKFIGGIRDSEVTVISGITSHGKTTFSMALIANLIKRNKKCLIISPEMQEYDLLLALANNHFKINVKTPRKIEEVCNKFANKLYIANVFNEWTNRGKQSILDRTFDIIEYAVRHKGVKFVLLDHLRLLINPANQEGERFAIDEFMRKCVRTAIANKIHIWLVVQPRKGDMVSKKGPRKITKDDLKGSSNIEQDAHNIVLIHRNTDLKVAQDLVEFEFAKVRSRVGNMGRDVLQFDMMSKANYYDREGKNG